MSLLKILESSDKLFEPGEEILLPIIRAHFLQKAHSPEYRPGFRVSSLPKLCCREEVFKVRIPRPMEDTEPDLQSIFETGHALHAHWQNKVLGPAGVLEGKWHCAACDSVVEGLMPQDICPNCKLMIRCGSCQKKLDHGKYQEGHVCRSCQAMSWRYEEYMLSSKTYGIEGHCDGILQINGERYIWEFKTINTEGFNTRILEAPLPEHVVQIQLYMWLRGLKKGIIHYLDKDKSKQREFVLAYNSRHHSAVVHKINTVNDALATGRIPDHRACSAPTNVRAKKCPWVKECFDAKRLKAALKSEK